MKRYIFAFAALILVAGIAFAGTKDQRILSIYDIQADPYAYKGTIIITGVVADKSRYRLDPEIFLTVATQEAKICELTGCARFYLPVRYEGKHPKEWDEVNITGKFAEIGGKILFAADKVEVLRHLSL
jgi:hypothetical protein